MNFYNNKKKHYFDEIAGSNGYMHFLSFHLSEEYPINITPRDFSRQKKAFSLPSNSN
jgi:hypothetical protein